MKEVLIVKSNGDTEPFNREKLESSLKKAGASVFLVEEIADRIESNLKKGSSTKDIYQKAFAILNKKNKPSALKYSIKRSLISLGPTGFPFEKFLGALMERLGYSTINGNILKGSCIEHEVDLIAYNDSEVILTEVKFHNDIGTKTDTKVLLYVKARFDDLKETNLDLQGSPNKMTKGLIITNTKFTDNAIKYAECSGVHVISWDYPEKGNLYDLINQTSLHPITCLESISGAQKESLIQQGIISCSQFKGSVDILDKMKISKSKQSKIFSEVAMICK